MGVGAGDRTAGRVLADARMALGASAPTRVTRGLDRCVCRHERDRLRSRRSMAGAVSVACTHVRCRLRQALARPPRRRSHLRRAFGRPCGGLSDRPTSSRGESAQSRAACFHPALARVLPGASACERRRFDRVLAGAAAHWPDPVVSGGTRARGARPLTQPPPRLSRSRSRSRGSGRASTPPGSPSRDIRTPGHCRRKPRTAGSASGSRSRSARRAGTARAPAR